MADSLSWALTTWYDGLRRCPRAGRSHHRSNKGTGPWAHSPPSHPGRALGDKSSPPDRPHCILHPGKRGSGRSGCRGSHTAGTPGPVGSSGLEEGEEGGCQQPWPRARTRQAPLASLPPVVSARSPPHQQVYFQTHKCTYTYGHSHYISFLTRGRCFKHL